MVKGLHLRKGHNRFTSDCLWNLYIQQLQCWKLLLGKDECQQHAYRFKVHLPFYPLDFHFRKIFDLWKSFLLQWYHWFNRRRCFIFKLWFGSGLRDLRLPSEDTKRYSRCFSPPTLHPSIKINNYMNKISSINTKRASYSSIRPENESKKIKSDKQTLKCPKQRARRRENIEWVEIWFILKLNLINCAKDAEKCI